MKYDYFISYCKENKTIAQYIFFKLTDMGFQIWFDDKDIKLSSNIKDTILSGLNQSKFVLAVISPHYLKSQWPLQELNITIQKEAKENRNILIPFIYNIDTKNIENNRPELLLKSYHIIETKISETSDLWLAKIINHFFEENSVDISINCNNIYTNNDELKILQAFAYICQANQENNNFHIVNLYNLGSYALYLCRKNGATVTNNVNIAYNYLKYLFYEACNYCTPISHFHTIACRKCVNIILDDLLHCYSR